MTVGLGDIFTVDIVADIDEPVLGWGLDLIIDNPSILSTEGLPVIDSAWFAAPFNPDGAGSGYFVLPCDDPTRAIVTYTIPMAADNCNPAPSVSCVRVSGTFFPSGITTVDCTASDATGNTAPCSFEVTAGGQRKGPLPEDFAPGRLEASDN